MAIINSYPNITPTAEDLLLISDTSVEGNPTKTASINSILALIPPGSGGGGGVSSVTSSNSNFLSVTNPTGPIVVLNLNTGPVQSGGNSLATTGDIYSFTTTEITNAINNLGTIGTVTQVSAVSSLAALSNIVTNPTTTPTITLGIVGSPTNSEFLRGDGTWAVPGSTGVGSITATAPITVSGTTITNIGITEATTSTNGYLSSTYWNIFNNKMPTFTITNNGTTGAAAFNSAGTELNIPVYTGGGGSGGVSSVGLTMPSAFTVSTPNPIISAGTFVVGGSGAVTQFIDGTGALQATSSIAGTYSWVIDGDSGAPTIVASGNTIEFAGGTSIETDWDSALKKLTIDYTGAAGITSIIATSSNTASLGPSTALTANGTLTIPWNGTGSDVVLGDGSLQALSTIPGTYTFSLQGDSGGPTAIASGGTIDIEGGTNITTTLTGNTLTIDGPSSLGTVTSVGSSDSNFISGGVIGPGNPITTTGNLEYSLRAIGSPNAATFLRGDGNGVWSTITNSSGIAAITNSTSSPSYETTIAVEYVGNRNVIASAPAIQSTQGALSDTIIINDTSGAGKVYEATLQETQDILANSLIPINFSIAVSATSTPVFKNQGNVTSDTQDFGGTLSDWTFANNSTSSEIICRVNFAGRTDIGTDYMVNIIFESSTEDQNGNEVPALGYVENKNANFFDFKLLPAGLTGKAAGGPSRVNFQIYK
jgi:hypothetical protein